MSTHPAATKAGGTATAAPDTCHLPSPSPPGGIPTPYVNVGSLDSTDKCTEKVVIMNKGACVEDSEMPSSHGDEAGCSNAPTPKGLVSQKNMGKVVFKTWSSKVKLEGKGAVTHTATTAHNGSNANAPCGKHTVASQQKVVIGG